MSVYGKVKTQMQVKHLDVLAEACDRLGLAYRVGENQHYHKWIPYTDYRRGKRGRLRGKDAVLVIENLDTIRHYCGETAFVPEADGSLRCEIDINHNNAPRNWQRLQNEYAAILVERKAARQGLKVVREETESGGLKLKLVPIGGATRTTAQRSVSRPTASRPKAVRRPAPARR